VQTPPWTAERIELLQKLWAEGETAASIAARLGGISRSAVLGKVFRLRLPVAGRKSGSPGAHAAAEIDCARQILAPTRRRRSARRKQEASPPASRPGRQHKTLLELTNNSCRWIVEAAIKWAVAWTLSHFQ
jgi:GcrA cell cycle regulator